jgi:RimJ/RimL family protein N-acetyltransferase
MSDIEIIKDGAPLALPIPIYSSIRLGSMRGKSGEEFWIVAGLDTGIVAELKEKSLDVSDEEIQNNTSDRARFGEGSYEEWYGKDRVPFALIDTKNDALAALAWFGPKPLGRKSLKHLSAEERKQDERLMDAGDWHTIVYRAYKPYRGTGLMKAFVKFSMDAYRAAHPHSKIWAGIYADNPASRALAEKLGFKMSEEASDPSSHEIVMILQD